MSSLETLQCDRARGMRPRVVAARRAAGAASVREGVDVGVASKMRRKLVGVLLKILRRKSGRRLKKRTRVGGPTVTTIFSETAAEPETQDASEDDADDDSDSDSESVSSVASDLSDVVIVDETPARPFSDAERARTSRTDLVRATAKALDLNVRSERGNGNCMFCAVSSGINTWLAARHTAGPDADEALFPVIDSVGVDVATRDSANPRFASSGSRITWAHLRNALVEELRAAVRDAPRVASVAASRPASARDAEAQSREAREAREVVMTTLMRGNQGRAWLTRGALASASASERFERYVDCMSRDAGAYAGQKTWRRYWGADIELVALASKLRVAVVCVETATNVAGLFLAAPAEVAERSRRASRASRASSDPPRPARLGKYMSDGVLESRGRLRWRAARGRIAMTVRVVRASSKMARRAVARRDASATFSKNLLLPALIVVHRPGHFDSLQPNRGWVLVMEREESDEM